MNSTLPFFLFIKRSVFGFEDRGKKSEYEPILLNNPEVEDHKNDKCKEIMCIKISLFFLILFLDINFFSN